MTGHPTPLSRAGRPQRPEGWLTIAQVEQLRRDLADLPELAEQLHRHYLDLVARGERGDHDPDTRYPARLTALDLADARSKGDTLDPIGEADLARRIGHRRAGVLPTLASWVRLADGEMWDDGHDHDQPTETPTVTTEAGWLDRHLEWIAAQQWVSELADELRDIVADLEQHVGPAYAAPVPDHHVVATAATLARILDVEPATVRSWIHRGHLPALGADEQGRALYAVGDGRTLKLG